MMPREHAVNELKATFRELKADLDAAVVFAKAEDSQIARRALVRALFAFIEGLTNQLSAVAAASAPRETGIFSGAELAALREEAYDVTDQGEVEVRAARITLKRRIRLALRYYPKIHGASFTPECGGIGWAALLDAIRVRDRLTHPKSSSDLSVSEDDVRLTGDASEWFQGTVSALLKACQEADNMLRRPPAQ